MSRDPLSPFEADLVESVAADYDRDPDALRGLLRRHQEQMRELPGVDDLVYEWRKTLPQDPLLQRREDAYLLVLDPAIWPQFAEAIGADRAELAALRAVHTRQLAAENGTALDGEATDGDADTDPAVDDADPQRAVADDREAMIVTRE